MVTRGALRKQPGSHRAETLVSLTALLACQVGFGVAAPPSLLCLLGGESWREIRGGMAAQEGPPSPARHQHIQARPDGQLHRRGLLPRSSKRQRSGWVPGDLL